MFKQMIAKLNPRWWFMSLAKKVAVREIQKQGDSLQSRLRLAVEEKGPKAVDWVVDEAQIKMKRTLEAALPKWSWLAGPKAKLITLIDQHGDELQANLKNQVALRGSAAVDEVCDQAQSLLIERINAL